jgi:hypothetical protein
MSNSPNSLPEVQALAEQSLGDPESSQHFLQALGVTPEAFAALDEQAQMQHLHMLAQQPVGVVKSGADVAQVVPERYELKPMQLVQSVFPYGILDRVTGERIHTGKQSDCTRMVKLLNQAFELGVSHARSDIQKTVEPRAVQSLGAILAAQKTADLSNPIEAARRRAGERSAEALKHFNEVEMFINHCKDELTRQILSGISADKVHVKFGMHEGAQNAEQSTQFYSVTSLLGAKNGPAKSIEPLWNDLQQWARESGLSVKITTGCYSGDRYSWAEVRTSVAPEQENAMSGRRARPDDSPSYGR